MDRLDALSVWIAITKGTTPPIVKEPLSIFRDGKGPVPARPIQVLCYERGRQLRRPRSCMSGVRDDLSGPGYHVGRFSWRQPASTPT